MTGTGDHCVNRHPSHTWGQEGQRKMNIKKGPNMGMYWEEEKTK